MKKWVAEITNNPERDFTLYIEILENDQFRARIQIGDDGLLEFLVYGGQKDVAFPVNWLVKILNSAKEDLA